MRRIKKQIDLSLAGMVDAWTRERHPVVSLRTTEISLEYLKKLIVFAADKRGLGDPTKWKREHAIEFRDHLISLNIKYACDAWSWAKRLFTWMEQCGHIDRSPFNGIPGPRHPGALVREPFTEDDFKAIISKCYKAPHGRQLITAITVGYYTGMSIGDCVRLKWQSVDLENCIIRSNRMKTGQLSTIPFERKGELHFRLEEARADFPNSEYVTPDLANRRERAIDIFRKIKLDAGVSEAKTFHNFRATMASRLTDAGVPSIVASRITGHRSLEIFNKYVTVKDEVLEEATRKAGYFAKPPEVGKEIAV